MTVSGGGNPQAKMIYMLYLVKLIERFKQIFKKEKKTTIQEWCGLFKKKNGYLLISKQKGMFDLLAVMFHSQRQTGGVQQWVGQPHHSFT